MTSKTLENQKPAPRHTAAPWKASPPSSVVGIAITAQPIPTENTILLASVISGRANARLIAAAPELLEEMERQLFSLGVLLAAISDEDQCKLLVEMRDGARAAIAKAGGK